MVSSVYKTIFSGNSTSVVSVLVGATTFTVILVEKSGAEVMEKLETWIEDLGQLPDLESCYAREILNLAYDVIHQQSKGDNASHI